MKHHIRTLARGAALLAAIVMIACGGKQTMASKSAAAYDEAKKKGIPIAAGEHGGHSNEADAPTDHAAMPGMDHSTMPDMKHGTATSGTSDMAGMDHSVMAGMDHSQMPGMKRPDTASSGSHDMAGMNHSAIPGMDHSKMPGMKKPDTGGSGAHDMAGMDHSAMTGMDHSKMPGMQHGSAAAGSHDMAGMPQSGTMAAMPGMQHGSPTAAPIVIPAPISNAAIAQTQPAETLRPDEFDAPATAAIEEASKGASGMSHSMETATPKAPASAQPKPQPPSEQHHHGGGEAS